MRCHIFTFLLMLLPLPALAQQHATIEGYVRDARTRTPLSDANVWMKDHHRGDVSDFRGYFRLERLPAGDHTVIFSFVGYEQHEEVLTLADGEKKVVEIFLRERPIIIAEEIIVRGSPVGSYPQSDLVMRHGVVQSPKDVGEFVQNVPNVSGVRRGGYGFDPVIRGFRYDQLNVQIDGGARVEGACPSRMDPPASHVASGDLEKIEVLKGPFALRFGSAFGGIINLVMAVPDRYESFTIDGKIQSGYESNFNGWQNRITVTGGSRLYDFRLSGGMIRYGNYTDGNGTEIPASFAKRDYTLKIGMNPEANHRVQLSFRQVFARDIQFPSLPMDERKDDTWILITDYGARNLSSWISSLNIKAYHSHVGHLMDNRDKPNAGTVSAVTDVTTSVSGLRAEVGLLIESSVLFVGTDVMRTEKSGFRTRNFVAGPRKGTVLTDNVWQDASITNAGLFAEFRSAVGDFNLISSGRLDMNAASAQQPDTSFATLYRSLKSNHTNTSLSLGVYRAVSKNAEIGALFGRGMRSPNIAERYINFLSIGLDRYDYVGNPSLGPEINNTLDLTLRTKTLLGSVSGNIFYSHVTDYISLEIVDIQPRNMDVLGVKRFVNITSAALAGFELVVSSEMTKNLHLQWSSAYTRGRNNKTGESLPEIPPFETTIALSGSMMNGKILPELSVRAVGRQRDISLSFGETSSPGFVVGNAAVRVMPFGFLTASLGVNNLLNKTYYEHLNRRIRTNGNPIHEPGRYFYVNIGLRTK